MSTTQTSGADLYLTDRSLRLSGPLLVADAAAVRASLVRALDALDGTIDIDLSEVTELDGAGVAAVLTPARQARRRGLDVRVRAPRAEQPRRFCELVRVLDLFGHPAQRP